MTPLRVHRLLDATDAEGPGRRACVWVQGCSIRCHGCFNPHTWNTRGGTVRHVAELAEAIGAVPDIEGLTLLGGEPFDQPAACAELAERAQGLGLSVMTFTGYVAARVPWDDAVLDADKEGVPLLDYDPDSPVVAAVGALADALLEG